MATTQYSTVNGREFGFYVPDSYDASKPTPLLFMFHGFGGDSSTSSGGSAERNYYGWQDTAEENGFITIFPEAQGWFKAWDLSPNGRSSDIGYVENLIDWAGDNYNISESQIFTTGHSWGAYFSYYVAANLSDKISAFGAHSGGFYSNPWLGGTPEVPTISEESPVLNGIILHAKDDEIVPYANSQTLYDNLLANGHNVYQDGVGKDGIIEVNGWGPQNHRWRLENNQEQWNFFTSVAPEPAVPEPTPEEKITQFAEFKTASVNHQWQSINLDLNYINPVVIASDPTRRGGDPAVVRLRNISSDSFEIRLQEPAYKDGWHVKEKVSFIVIEEGTWELSDGTTLKAGLTHADILSSQGRNTISIGDAFGAEDSLSILTQTQTFQNTDWLTTRTDKITGDSFELLVQKEEKLNSSTLTKESIGWLAIEQGTGTDGDTILEGGVTADIFNHRTKRHSFSTDFDTAPTLLTKLNSFDGPDSANSRIRSVDAGGFRATVAEERSRDFETFHTTERLSYLALGADSGVLNGLVVM